MEQALVVHLMSPGAAAVRFGWDAPDGSVRHEVASWRDMPSTLSAADLVVAHGLAALVVAQSIADIGPGLVYRPAGATRLEYLSGFLDLSEEAGDLIVGAGGTTAVTQLGWLDVERPRRRRRDWRRELRWLGRRRWYRRLRVAWIAASDSRTGLVTAASLGLGKSRVVVVADDDRAAWNVLVSSLLHDEPISDDLRPVAPRGLGALWSILIRTLSRAGARADDRRAADARSADPTATDPGQPAERVPDPQPFVATASDAPRGSSDIAVVDTATQPVPRAEKPPPRLPAAPLPDADRPSTITASHGASDKLAMGDIEPTSPGHRWWMYRRPEMPPEAPERAANGAAANGAAANGAAAAPPGGGGRTSDPEPRDGPRSDLEIVPTVTRSGVGFFVVGATILATVAVCTQLGTIGEAPFIIPIAGLFLALAAARRISRNHPAEDWVGRWLVFGLIAKLLASYFRYYTLVHTYNGLGDAGNYDKYGRLFATAWLTGGHAPVLTSLHATNFLRWFTGVVYYVAGSNLLTGTFVFALLALVGSYFWYRATVEAVPMLDRRLYLGFVLFAPSIAFWPAEVGKEALMQLGLGTVALGTSFLLRQRLLPGFAIVLAGGWLLWVVRPHLLAMVAIAAGAAYLAGRVRSRGRKPGLLSRPLGIIVVAFLVAFTIGQGAKFLGLTSFSFSSIQTELDTTTAQSAQGGSHFNNGGNTLNPINYPRDAVTVLIRPFPWETSGGLQLLASAEGMALAGLMVWRFGSLRFAFSRSRETPFLMFCWVLTALYCVSFSSFANFGLLVRERSLVLPAVLVLIAVDPALGYRRRESEPRLGEWTVGTREVEAREVGASAPAGGSPT